MKSQPGDHRLKEFLPWVALGFFLGVLLLIVAAGIGFFTRRAAPAAGPSLPVLTVVAIPSATPVTPLESSIAFLGVESEVFELGNGPNEVDGYEWWYLVNPYNPEKSGWAVANYLRRADSP